MNRLALAVLSGGSLVLAACSSQSEPAPSATPEQSPAALGPRTLVAAGLQVEQLGPRIVGPQGPEVESEISFEGQPVARMISYVTCPAPAEGEVPTEECVPANMPEGTLYTYVHRVISTGADAEAQPFAFRTTRAATGFTNLIGFDRTQAEVSLGADYSIGVAEDAGLLIWRIEAGNGWGEGEELTFFWQSTVPPEGPAVAFEIQNNTGTADLTGPFPPAQLTGDTASAD